MSDQPTGGLWRLEYRAKGDKAWTPSVMRPGPYERIDREFTDRMKLTAYSDKMEHRMVPHAAAGPGD